MQALDYLRAFVTPIVDHNIKEEEDIFKKLCTHLCVFEDDPPVTTFDTYSARSINGNTLSHYILYI